MNNIIKAVINRESVTTVPAYQWDYGMILNFSGAELPEEYEVHFSNTGDDTSTTVHCSGMSCEIPDAYFENGKDIDAYIYIHTGEADGETIKHIHIPVIQRLKPEGA